MEPIVCTLKGIKDVTKCSINGRPPPRGWILKRGKFVFLLPVKSIEKKFQIKKRTRQSIDHTLKINVRTTCVHLRSLIRFNVKITLSDYKIIIVNTFTSRSLLPIIAILILKMCKKNMYINNFNYEQWKIRKEEEIHSSPISLYFIIYQKKLYIYTYHYEHTQPPLIHVSIPSPLPSSFDRKNRTSVIDYLKRSLTKKPPLKEETLRTSTILNRRSVSSRSFEMRLGPIYPRHDFEP